MAIIKTIEIDVISKKAVQGIKNLINEISKTEKEVNNSKEGLKDFTNVADGLSGGMISKFGSLTGTLSKVASGFKGIGAAIAASGIGLLVLAISSVAAAFNASEEGQNKFAKIMGVIGSVVGNVMDVISDLGEIIIGVLSGDSEAIKSATAFGKKIFDVVGLPIKNIISVVQTAANVIKGLWNDGIDGALTALENGVEDVKGNFKDAANAINDGANALKKFGEEALKEAKIAQQIADQRAKADKTDRELIVQRAEADRKVAELREKALDREKYNTKQRIGFLNEASKVEQEVTNKEIESAKLRRDAIIEENKLSKSNKDALKAEEEAKAAVINLETKRLNLQKALTAQISSLKQQEKAENQAAFNEKKKTLDDEQKLKAEALERIRQGEIDTEAERRAEELKKVQEQYILLIAEATKYGQDTTALKEAQLTKEKELADKFALEDSEKQKAKTLKEQEEKIKNLELSKEFDKLTFDEQRNILTEREALLLADKTLNEEQQNSLKKQYSDARIKIDELEAQAKEKMVAAIGQTLATASELLGKNTVAGKAMAVAATTVDTLQSSISAYKGMVAAIPGPAGIAAGAVAAAGSIATGLATVKKIVSVKVPGKGGGGSAPSISSSGGGVAAPSFNVVGNSGVNQIAQTLGNQQPMQAYVVANNVTTQQSLDRNIVNNASLG